MGKISDEDYERLCSNVWTELQERGIEVRCKPNYKNWVDQTAANIVNAMFWCVRNWYFLVGPSVFLAGLLTPFSWITLITTSCIVLIGGLVCRYFEVGMSDIHFDHFFTTMNGTIYCPSRWDWWLSRGVKHTLKHNPGFLKVIVHEFKHVLQEEWIGSLLYKISYIGVLPCGLTVRSVIEFGGYTQNMRLEYHFSEEDKVPESTKQFVVDTFLSPKYFWMVAPIPWVSRKIVRYFVEKRARQIEEGRYTGMGRSRELRGLLAV